VLGLLSASAVLADPPTMPAGDLDLLANLRTDPDNYSCDLRIAELEPLGGEEYLGAWVEQLENYIDDELEYCQSTGLLSGTRQRSTDGANSFTPDDRSALLEEAERNGCDSRKRLRTKATRLDRIAKRWRTATEKFADFNAESATASQLARCIESDYDAEKFGQVDATDLYCLLQRVRLQDAVLRQAEEYFLMPVSGVARPVVDLQDWQLHARQSTPFGQEVPTPGGTKRIENIVNEIILVGSDETFSDVPAGTETHSFEGYFLYSRQMLSSDDVTSTVVLVRRPEFDSLVERVRNLLADYARIHEFRTKQLAERPLQYVQAEFTAESLFPEAATIQQTQSDSDERLRALQTHFGAPVGRRTRTTEWKAISWTGPLTGFTESFEAEMRLDTGVAGAPLHKATFDAKGTPLADAACGGELKLGQMVNLVGKVAKLEYDGSPDGGALHFTLSPLLGTERAAGEAEAETTKSKPDEKSTKPKPPRQRRPRGRVPGPGTG
jgi:hypothetical protein